MKMLALELSSEVRSVAVLLDGEVVGHTSTTGCAGRTSLGLVADALSEASLQSREIDCIAVGIGPGSYTGVRSAIALAQGWHLACGIRILAVSSVECLAVRAQTEKIFGHVNIVIDAQRNEFYLAAYELSSSARTETEALHLVGMEEVKARLATREIFVGPEVTRWFAAAKVLCPDAVTLGRIAHGRKNFIDAEKLEPIYLRETSFVKAPFPRIIA